MKSTDRFKYIPFTEGIRLLSTSALPVSVKTQFFGSVLPVDQTMCLSLMSKLINQLISVYVDNMLEDFPAFYSEEECSGNFNTPS